MSIDKWLSLISLAISIIGSAILYIGSPIDNGKNTSMETLTIASTPEENAKKEKGIKSRHRLSQIGFALLFVGFIIQFIAVFYQAP